MKSAPFLKLEPDHNPPWKRHTVPAAVTYMFLHGSGWLTGKIKRNQAPEPNSRVAFASEDKRRVMEAAPDYDTLNTEKTWQILEKMEEMSKSHGIHLDLFNIKLIMSQTANTFTVILIFKWH